LAQETKVLIGCTDIYTQQVFLRLALP